MSMLSMEENPGPRVLAGRSLAISDGVCGCGEDFLDGESLPRVLRWCLLGRLGLVSLLFLFSLGLHARNEGIPSPSDIGALFKLLVAAWGFSVLSVAAVRFEPARSALRTLQVGWDLLFAVAWIYCTGGSGSLFVFLYLFVIMEATALLGTRGSILTALLCGLFYWAELHLEIHGNLWPRAAPIAASIVSHPGTYPVGLLVFILASMLSTAWLTTTLRKRVSQAGVMLREQSAGLRNLMNLNDAIVRCIRSGLVTLDMEGRITSFNEAASSITGFSAGQVLGERLETVLGVLPPEALASEGDRGSLPVRWEQLFQHRDGRLLTLGLSASVLQDHTGNPFGHLLIFQDLTSYKQMEEELRRAEKLAAIGELAAGLAHEIRNPLASLYGSIQLLQGKLELAETNRRLMQIILQESERLNELIGDFLLFASPRPGTKEEFCLLPLVEETVALLEKHPSYREGIRVFLRIDRSVKLFASRKQMQQIFWNLLLNAVQALPDGKGEIRVEAESKARRNDPAGRVTIRIRDTGRGIQHENLDRIFDPFFTTREEGTGLGLSVVYRIVESHGGRIRVSSDPGAETVFEIDLPGKQSSPDGGRRQEMTEFTTEGRRTRSRTTSLRDGGPG